MGRSIGVRNVNIRIMTSPANMFPKRRNVKLTSRTSSEINSSIPTKASMMPSMRRPGLNLKIAMPSVPKLMNLRP